MSDINVFLKKILSSQIDGTPKKPEPPGDRELSQGRVMVDLHELRQALAAMFLGRFHKEDETFIARMFDTTPEKMFVTPDQDCDCEVCNARQARGDSVMRGFEPTNQPAIMGGEDSEGLDLNLSNLIDEADEEGDDMIGVLAAALANVSLAHGWQHTFRSANDILINVRLGR